MRTWREVRNFAWHRVRIFLSVRIRFLYKLRQPLVQSKFSNIRTANL